MILVGCRHRLGILGLCRRGLNAQSVGRGGGVCISFREVITPMLKLRDYDSLRRQSMRMSF